MNAPNLASLIEQANAITDAYNHPGIVTTANIRASLRDAQRAQKAVWNYHPATLADLEAKWAYLSAFVNSNDLLALDWHAPKGSGLLRELVKSLADLKGGAA